MAKKKKEVIDQSIEILRRRVDETGTLEPTITRQGDERILLQVPGIKDTTDLKRKINQTAKLTFHLVNEDVAATGQNIPQTVPPTTFLVPTREGMQELRRTNPKAWDDIQAANPRLSPEQICRRYQPQCLPVLKRIVVGGEDLDDSKATFEQQQGGRPIISFTFNSAGGRASCAATRANIGKRLADPARRRDHQRAGRAERDLRRQRHHHRQLHDPADAGAVAAAALGRAAGDAQHHPGKHRRRRPGRGRHPGRHGGGAGRHGAGGDLHVRGLRPGVRRLRQPRHAGEPADGVRRHVDPGRLAHPAGHRGPRADGGPGGRRQRADL